jgi:hypothetical protein
MELSCVGPNQNRIPTLGLMETWPQIGGKQGELVRTCTSLKCIPKGWLVVATNAGNHDPIRVLYRVAWDLGFGKTQMLFLVP